MTKKKKAKALFEFSSIDHNPKYLTQVWLSGLSTRNTEKNKEFIKKIKMTIDEYNKGEKNANKKDSREKV